MVVFILKYPGSPISPNFDANWKHQQNKYVLFCTSPGNGGLTNIYRFTQNSLTAIYDYISDM